MAQTADSGDQSDSKRHHPSVCGYKTCGKKRKATTPQNTGELLAKTIRHFFRLLPQWIAALPDPRATDQKVYDAKHLFWCGVLMFALHLKSRRQFSYESDSPVFLKNILALSQTSEKTVAHRDTLAYFFEKIPSEHLESLLPQMIRHLIRNKVLDAFRLDGRFLIAVDGTGQFCFHKKHCEHCLTQKKTSGETLYLHSVLEAKLVTQNGMAFSIATEFIENSSPTQSKQDCELKAFYRLMEKLKLHFPKTPLCFLLDGLYAAHPVFLKLEQDHRKFMVTFKSGSIPSLYEEAETLKNLSPQNKKEIYFSDSDKKQVFQWVNDVPYEGQNLNVLWCSETWKAKTTTFVWISNFKFTYKNVEHLANQGGRNRWKIENEGFNAQKNGGFALEHAYSLDCNAAKNFYFLLQIAHLFVQLLAKGSLFENFIAQMGSLRNFSRRLAESLRNVLIETTLIQESRFQIRFSSA